MPVWTVRRAALWYESDFTRRWLWGSAVHDSRRHLHGVHEPERPVWDGQGIVLQVRVDDSGRSEGLVKLYALSRRSSMVRPMAARMRAHWNLVSLPAILDREASVTVPVKVGLSLGDYYEGSVVMRPSATSASQEW